MKTMNIKHTAKKQCVAKSTALKTAPPTSVVLGIPHFSQVFPKAMQHGFNPISSI
jgi:hypothetical protein